MKAFAFLVSFLVSLVPHVVPGFTEPREVGAPIEEAGGAIGRLDPLALPVGVVSDAPGAPLLPPASEPEAVEPEEAASNGTAEERPRLSKPPPAQAPAPFVARFDPAEPLVLDGSTAFTTLVVENRHSWPLSIAIEKRDATAGWRVTLAAERVDVEPGESAEVPVTLDAPLGALPGALGKVTLALTTPLPPVAQLASVIARVPVPETFYDVAIVNSDGARSIAPGDAATFSFSVTNLGNAADSFQLDLGPGTAGWAATLSRGSVTLDAGEGASVTLTVSAPADSPDGAASWFNVTARSLHDASKGSQAASLTVVDVEDAGVPLVGVICVGIPRAEDATAPADPASALYCVDPVTLLPALPTLPDPEASGAPAGTGPAASPEP